ncbi:MAG TPA: multicopper oxidase domain-containing protein [Gaiellaceae bacterium]|nr:multicopper oxidase domain-containing protein [Gaiellaceae bacterium]
MAYPATQKLSQTHRHTRRRRREREETTSGALFKVVALLLGFLVGALALVAVLMWADARNSRAAAPAAETTAGATGSMAGMDGMAARTASVGAYATPSFAGLAPENAAALAAAHRPYPAELPATTPGPVVAVHLTMTHKVLQIAPGISYEAWTFGDSVPGPTIHARQGQTVRVTLTNDAPMPHSVDFHAALAAPNEDFVDVAPGASFTFSFTAEKPGVFMYHCGTKPVLAHIANGMFGAIVVDPADPSLLPPAHHNYVLVSGEWYLNGPGLDGKPAALDMVKARQMTPDWVTWNGYAGQYVAHPLEAHPGHVARFYVVDAGPSLDTDFHVVGTVLKRAWLNGDVEDPPQHDIQTALVPAGGGAIFDVQIDKPGLYPFVSHLFASVDMGEAGVLRVGDVPGTMSH